MSQQPQPQEPIIIPMEDDLVHTDEHPFCDDSLCGCHDDRELFKERIYEPFQEGFLSKEEMFRLHWNRHF